MPLQVASLAGVSLAEVRWRMGAMAIGSGVVAGKVPAETRSRYRRLRALNVFAGVLLAAEATCMLRASNNLVLR